MKIGEICTRDTVIAKKDNTIVELAKLMRQHHVGDIVVVSEGENAPIGIVTDRDIVIEILAKELSHEAVTAGDIMNRDVLMAHENDDIWDTLQRMRIRGVRRIPVINRSGGLVGIATLDDLLELLADELEELAKTVRREQEQERSTRK
ncbi:MAG: CBS domain-containing protein [Gammaproteobacteria bacterium]|nr:CBS domain-containing protein [Gammaproteobacteria bacterium]